jgi:hypothetical protein
MRNNSKSRGSGFEREIAKTLTLWITGKEKPYVLWRTPSSGAMITNKVSTDASGDIIAIMPEGRVITDVISMEAKVGYAEVDLMKHFKKQKNNILEGFWEQCIRDSRIANKHGMLIYRKKGYPIVIGVEKLLIDKLQKQKDVKLPKSISLIFESDLPEMVMFDFIDFFGSITPKNLLKIKGK